jgi:hypothetical protein
MNYSVQSLLFLDTLTEEDIQRHMCSDRIWLPRHDFELYLSQQEAGAVLVLRLTNGVGQTVVGTPFGYHHDRNNAIYVPQWMLEMLEYETENVRIDVCTPSLCSRIRIVPFTSEHLVAEDPQIYFRDGFEAYTCIQRGLVVPLFSDGKSVTVSVDDVIPNTDEPLCIRDVELELDLARPLDRPPTPPVSEPVSESVPEPVVQPSPDEVRRLCRAAAVLRAKGTQS